MILDVQPVLSCWPLSSPDIGGFLLFQSRSTVLTLVYCLQINTLTAIVLLVDVVNCIFFFFNFTLLLFCYNYRLWCDNFCSTNLSIMSIISSLYWWLSSESYYSSIRLIYSAHPGIFHLHILFSLFLYIVTNFVVPLNLSLILPLYFH